MECGYPLVLGVCNSAAIHRSERIVNAKNTCRDLHSIKASTPKQETLTTVPLI